MSDTSQGTAFFIATLSDATRHVLSQIAGREVAIELGETVLSPLGMDVPFQASGPLNGAFSLRFTPRNAVLGASLLTGEPVTGDSTLTDEVREALDELIRQICGAAASVFRQRFGSLEIQHRPELQLEIDGADARLLTIDAGDSKVEFQLIVTQELAQSLEANEKRVADAAAAVAKAPTSAPAAAAPAAAAPYSAPMPPSPSASQEKSQRMLRDSNLDILLDLELSVSLRFGTRNMLLKEVLELTTGSVVELDRRVQEPVDLLIDNKLIARGEVVLIDGHYGLRVMEVAPPRDRITCLP